MAKTVLHFEGENDFFNKYKLHKDCHILCTLITNELVHPTKFWEVMDIKYLFMMPLLCMEHMLRINNALFDNANITGNLAHKL